MQQATEAYKTGVERIRQVEDVLAQATQSDNDSQDKK